MSTCKEVLETWFQRVWTEQDADAIDELFIPDGPAKGLGKDRNGPAEFREFHSALVRLLTDFVITIDKSIEEDDWIAAVCTLRARSRQSEEAAIEITGSVMIRISDGKLIEAYNHWDFIGIFSQLGLLPADTFARALGGESII